MAEMNKGELVAEQNKEELVVEQNKEELVAEHKEEESDGVSTYIVWKSTFNIDITERKQERS